MPNPNPKLENLTRAGMGQPNKDTVRRNVSLPGDLDKRFQELQEYNGTKFSVMVQDLLKIAFGMPSYYNIEEWQNICSLDRRYQDL